MRRTRLIAALAVFVMLVLSSGAATAKSEPLTANAQSGTGGNMTYQEILQSMGPRWQANNDRLGAQKEADFRRWKAAREAQRQANDGEVAPMAWPYVERYLSTPVIGQAAVHSVDTWYNSTTTPYKDGSGTELYQWNGPNNYTTAMKSKTPVDLKKRSCAHCGTAATLVLLRYMGSIGQATVSDLSTDDGLAILQLGIGWMNGQPDTYPNNTVTWAIQECCDGSVGSEYRNNMGRAVDVMNTRAPGYYFMLQTPTNRDDFEQKVIYGIDHGYPVILSIQTNLWKPYNTKYLGGHNLLIDGYKLNQETGERSFRINDVNNCAFNWSAGKYFMDTADVWAGVNWLIW